MKLPITLAVFLAITTPASANNIMDWDCGKGITVTIMVGHGDNNTTVEINGINPLKDRVTFKLMPITLGYKVYWAYLNGRACKSAPSGGQDPLELEHRGRKR